jgi:hypothetical protein
VRTRDVSSATVPRMPAPRAAWLPGMLLLAACLLAVPAAAQPCLGRPSFSDAPWQAGVESSFSDSDRSFGPSLSRGIGDLFVGVLGDVVGFSGIDESAVSLGGTIGVDRGVGRDRRVHVCPVATALHEFGPSVGGTDFSADVASFGGRLGIVASENPTVQVVPTFGVDFQVERDTALVSGQSTSSSTNFTVARFGVGFVLNGRTSVVPEIIELFGVASDTTFRVTAAFSFGRH